MASVRITSGASVGTEMTIGDNLNIAALLVGSAWQAGSVPARGVQTTAGMHPTSRNGACLPCAPNAARVGFCKRLYSLRGCVDTMESPAPGAAGTGPRVRLVNVCMSPACRELLQPGARISSGRRWDDMPRT